MKKIGKQVLMLETKEGNPRNGEGSFVRLQNGVIMHVYTEYYGTDWCDDAIARISACYSNDEGESWSSPTALIEKDSDAENIMSPSLFRMQNGEIGIVYLRKSKDAEGGLLCMPVFSYSADEGKSWSTPILCCAEDGYYCAINDGAIVQKNGRILVPFSNHGKRFSKAGADYAKVNMNVMMQKQGTVLIAYSDDNGRSWGLLPHEFFAPFGNDNTGFGEPGVYEHEDGTLWMWTRSAYGHQYQSHSRDGGMTWSPAIPNFCFTSPDAPMRVKKVGAYTVAVFNPLSYNCLRTDSSSRGSVKRTPFVCAVSTDDGHSFDTTGKTFVGGAFSAFDKSCRLLEDDYTNSYCYPSIIEVKDGFLVAYYHSNNSSYTLNSTKITKVYFSELEQ